MIAFVLLRMPDATDEAFEGTLAVFRAGTLAALDAATALHAVVRDFVTRRIVNGVHDCSDGGLAVAIAEMAIAGGVGANQLLRTRLKELGETIHVAVHYPRPQFCTDNGAMIAYAGCQRLLANQHEPLAVNVKARWPLDSLPPL